MNTACCQPVLIIEGEGDRSAMPILIRRILEANGRFTYRQVPNPIERQNVPKLERQAELERFIEHGMAREGDSLLVLLDTDDGCPKIIAEDFVSRVRKLYRTKKIGFCFFKPEFEAMFLVCLDQIAPHYPEYGWSLNRWDANRDFEVGSGSKGHLSSLMKRERNYKETRDQARFANVMDLGRLRQRCRAFRHLESLLIWLTDAQLEGDAIYPRMP